jgi:hypothetical protein
MHYIAIYDPRPAVLRWLQDEEKRHRETPKALKQEWFNTVFKAAAGDSEPQLKQEDKPVKRKFQLVTCFVFTFDKVAVNETSNKKVVLVQVKMSKFGTYMNYTHDKWQDGDLAHQDFALFKTKCTKTHLHASAVPKFFPGVVPRTPLKRGEEGIGEGRRDRDIDGEGIETRGGRNKVRKEEEEEGKGGVKEEWQGFGREEKGGEKKWRT